LRHERVTAEIQEVAALYALGSLNQHELREFELHLGEGCPICRGEASRFEQVVGKMAMGAAEREPPVYVRDLLAARIEREPHAATPSIPTGGQTEKESPASAPSLFQSPPPPERTFLPWFVAAACAIAAILCIFAWRRSESSRVGLQEKAGAAQGEADQVRAILESERGRTMAWEPIFAALGEPGTKIILLSGQTAAPSAAAALIWAAGKDQWFLSGRFPALPEGKTYQLWLLTPKTKINAALVKTDSAGHAFARFEIPPDLGRQITQAQVTIEPAGGSAQPSLPAYVTGKAGP
jgi:anti-sigma-K factor RskA